MNTVPTTKRDAFLQEVQEFRRKRVSTLRNINHWWNITLTVAGITLTAITTVLGVIENEEYKDWLKLGIALSGSVAVLSQSASKEFRVRGKAGKYAKAEADLLIIEHKTKNLDKNLEDDTELKKLHEDFYKAINFIGEIEAQTDENDK